MKTGIFVVLICALLVIPATLSRACYVTITALVDGQVAFSYSKDISDTGTIDWNVGKEHALGADFEYVIVNANGDPSVGIEFGVRNQTNADKVYNFISNVADINPPYVNATASASASFTLTDRAESTVGSTMTGLLNGSIYQARYNGSVVFAGLGNVITYARPSTNLTGRTEKGFDSGNSIIPIPVSSIVSEVSFTLSANDAASGTTDFVVIPEPLTLSLLGAGALAMLRRKQ